jgi:hypothetical protein
MRSVFIAVGNLKDGRVVELDEPLPLANAHVRITVEPLSPRQVRPLSEVLAQIHADQAARGVVPPTREEVDGYLEAGRTSRSHRGAPYSALRRGLSRLTPCWAACTPLRSAPRAH